MVELLVVVAIIAVLASMLLLPLSKAKQKAHNTRCLSNLRQIGIGLTLYTSDNNERFPYASSLTAGGNLRMIFVDFWQMIHPYVSTNGSFFVCTADRGPFNIVVSPLLGMNTNQIAIPASYVFSMGLYTEPYPEGLTGFTWGFRQRYVHEVHSPSQKFSASCYAIRRKDEINIEANTIGPVAHGKARRMHGFVDGHAALVPRSQVLWPPGIYWAFEPSPPDWQDVQ